MQNPMAVDSGKRKKSTVDKYFVPKKILKELSLP